MLKSYLKTAFRNLLRHKTFSFINILGFSFGISVCLLIAFFLVKEYSYDSYNVNASHIYRLIDTGNNTSAIDYHAAARIRDNFPEVKNVCVAFTFSGKIGTSYKDNGFDIDGVMSVDSSFFRMFTTHFVMGDPSRPLPDQNSVILSESAAHKLFGNENPLGNVITMWREYNLTVTGVIEDFPANSSFDANMIVNMENNNFKFSRAIDVTTMQVHHYFFNVYLQLAENANRDQLVQKINAHNEVLQSYAKGFGLISLKDMYLNDNTTGGTTKRGNPDLLSLLTGIALVVLILAITNYINLSIAQQNKRNKETGIRKTIGAGRRDIVALFLTESVLMTLAAFGVALVITEAALPFFGNIVDAHLTIEPVLHFPGNALLLASIFLIGVIAGLAPALLFSSSNPIKVLSNRLVEPQRRSLFRNLLTVFQFTVSIALVFCVIVIERQINFAKHKNLGFDKEQLLRVDLPFLNSKEDIARADAFTNKLREYSAIEGVTASQGVPGDVHINMGIGGKDRPIGCIFVDSSFINTFRIQIVRGRGPLPGDYGKTCLINETAHKYYDWKQMNNKLYEYNMKGGMTLLDVIGVVRDFHTSSMHKPIDPTCIMFASDIPPSSITLRIRKGGTAQTMTYLAKEWKEVFPDVPLNYQFYDEWFDQMYKKDDRFGDAIGLFAFLAVGISCLGILGLATFSSERRAKEIGIRKVHGATVNDLMVLLNKDFIGWVVMAFVVACPIGWYAMNRWLQEFAYRAEMSWWIFALSGVIALVIALLTVSWQTWRAATANPVEALRYE